jgi:3-methyladenine DNA glycosylase AlkD
MTWARTVVSETVKAFEPLADPAKAAAMKAYMKDVAPFLGISSPDRSDALRVAWLDVPKPTEQELATAARLLYAKKEREYHYAAVDLVGRYVRPARSTMSADLFHDLAEELITTISWWDTVDSLHSALIGPMLARNPELIPTMRAWNGRENRWLVRSSIIHQLGRKKTTDAALLFELCANRGADKEFFIAKGIGWALREYSYTDPAAVVAFIANTPLQPLSIREGLKAISRKQARASE